MRLEDATFQSANALNTMFLFQTGAIRSGEIYTDLDAASRFYSKLVRLEENVSELVSQAWYECFYSKLVRLEAQIIIGWLISLTSFYSKLVRLEAVGNMALRPLSEVSIPNWCD